MATDARATRLSAGGRDLYDLVLERIDGWPMRLARHMGRVLMVVNVASRSPDAAQLQELDELHRQYGPAGLRILGFPCNDFGGMEPGSNSEIRHHYERELGLSFALFSKVQIAGTSGHELFAMLTSAEAAPSLARHAIHGAAASSPTLLPSGSVRSNFEKFLVDRDGRLLCRFGPQEKPQARELLLALRRALDQDCEASDAGSMRPRRCDALASRTMHCSNGAAS